MSDREDALNRLRETIDRQLKECRKVQEESDSAFALLIVVAIAAFAITIPLLLAAH